MIRSSQSRSGRNETTKHDGFQVIRVIPMGRSGLRAPKVVTPATAGPAGQAGPAGPAGPAGQAAKKIPVFDSTGEFRGQRSGEAATRLVEHNFATAVRNRKGFIVALHLIGDGGASPIRSTAHVGTRYSFQDKLESGDRPWDLKRLSGKRGGLNYAPTSVRGIFLEVLVSCMVPAVAPEPA